MQLRCCTTQLSPVAGWGAPQIAKQASRLTNWPPSRKGLLTAAFRTQSPDKDREPCMSQLLLAIDAVLGEMERQAFSGLPQPDSLEERKVCLLKGADQLC